MPTSIQVMVLALLAITASALPAIGEVNNTQSALSARDGNYGVSKITLVPGKRLTTAGLLLHRAELGRQVPAQYFLRHMLLRHPEGLVSATTVPLAHGA